MSTNQIEDVNSYENVANEIQNYLGMFFSLQRDDNPIRTIHVLKCATLSSI